MAFGEVLGFLSAMFPPVGQSPQSPGQILAACLPLCASEPEGLPALSPVQQMLLQDSELHFSLL